MHLFGITNDISNKILLFIGVTGLLLTAFSLHREARVYRQEKLQQAQLIAQSLDLGHLAGLSEARSATEALAVQRLQAQLSLLGDLFQGSRRITLLGKAADGTSIPLLDSHPGRPRLPDSPELNTAFADAAPGIEGVRQGSQGQVLSVLVPVPVPHRPAHDAWHRAPPRPPGVHDRQPASDPVRATWVLRMESDSREGNLRLLTASLPPLACTFALAALLLLGTHLKARHSPTGPGATGWSRHIEPTLILSMGLVLSAFAAWPLERRETETDQGTFTLLASQETSALAEILRTLRDTELEGLARSLDQGHEITEQAFRHHTDHLLSNTAVAAWEWVAAVPSTQRASFETLLQAEGNKGFRIWEERNRGEHLPASGRELLHPVTRVNPLEGNRWALGFDVGSEPLRRAALEEARRSGVPVATDPIRLVQETGTQKGMLIFHALHSDTAKPGTGGYAVAVLRLGSLARSNKLNRELLVELALLHPSAAPENLGRSWDNPGLPPGTQSFVRPILAFGKAFAVTVRPGPDFVDNHRPRAAWMGFLIGLLLSTAAAFIVRQGVDRQSELERLVAERTLALAQSELSYRNQFAGNSSAMLLIDPEQGRILDANQAALDFYGHSRERILTLCIDDINTLPREQVAQRMASIPEGASRLFEFQHRLADGSVRDVEVSSSSILIGSRTVLHSIVHDITERKRAEAARREMEQRLSYAMEASGDGIWDWNVPTGHVKHNSRWCDILGLDNSFLEHQVDAFVQRVHPEDLTTVMEAVQNCLQNDTPYTSTHRMRHTDGHVRWVSDRGHVVERDSQGKPLRMVGSISDITEKAQAEAMLRVSESNFRSLFSSITDIIIVAGTDGRLIFANEAVTRILGYEPEEITTLNVLDLHPADRRSEAEDIFAAMFRGDRASCPLPLASKGGELVPVETRVWFGEWNGSKCIFGISKNLTAEREAQQRFERLFRNNPSLMALSDLETHHFTDVNEAFLRTLGLTREEVIGRSAHELDIFVDMSEFQKSGNDLLATGRIVNRELRIRNRRGEVFDGLFSGEIITSQGRRHFLTVMIDITAQKNAERLLIDSNRQLKEATQRANQASAAKSEFLANMSHEIRTPINGVLGMLDLLQGTPLNDEQTHYAALAHASGETLLNLINDILDFSKIEAQKLRLQTVEFDLEHLVESSVEMLAIAAQKKGINLACLVREGIPRRLLGDASRLRQVLVNLAGNAVKFTEKGEVFIEVSPLSQTETATMLRFSIRDTGIGIPKEKIDHLFAKFTQVDSSATRQYGGTGLGLAISKQLAELMQGEIGVRSTLGEGSEFWFTVRLSKDPVPNREPGRIVPELQGLRALVGLCHPRNTRIMQELLRRHRMVVTSVDNGKDLGESLLLNSKAGTPFDFVIVDEEMEHVDWSEPAMPTAEGMPRQQPRLILCTGHTPTQGRLPWQGPTPAGKLTRPLQHSVLRSTLQTAWLHPAGSEGRSTQPPLAGQLSEQARRARLLVAEDNPINQEVTGGILRNLGLQADIVSNGFEVLTALRQGSYDLILMDVQMPELDGLEATRRIRNPISALPNPGIPIVAMTAHAMQGDREQCLEAGMNDYISKPVALPDLLRILERHLQATPQKAAANRNLPPGEKPPPGLPLPALPVPGQKPAPGRAKLVFDKQGMMERLMNDRPMAAAVAGKFLELNPAQVLTLRQLFEKGDALTVAFQTHAIRGSSASLGGEVLGAVALRMENAAKKNDLPAAHALLEELEQEAERLRQVLRTEFAEDLMQQPQAFDLPPP